MAGVFMENFAIGFEIGQRMAEARATREAGEIMADAEENGPEQEAVDVASAAVDIDPTAEGGTTAYGARTAEEQQRRQQMTREYLNGERGLEFADNPGDPTPAGVGGEDLSYADQPGSATMDPNDPQQLLRDGIFKTAQRAGQDPLDLATILSYETGGTFDPTKPGPVTQWGQHKGLLQFGEPQARQYGVDWDNPLASQLGIHNNGDGAIARYFLDRGRPGMDLLDMYSTVNAGAPGLYNRSDANNGGAPGTVRDKVKQQMGPHRQNALRLLYGEGGIPDAMPGPGADGPPTGQAGREDAQGRDRSPLMPQRRPPPNPDQMEPPMYRPQRVSSAGLPVEWTFPLYGQGGDTSPVPPAQTRLPSSPVRQYPDRTPPRRPGGLP